MTDFSLNVADYLIRRLAALGIDRVFGVPGDYSFPLDDAIETTPGLEWVVCSNELNAAYAADGYARIRGVAMLTTTYGVGELSAINGLMGARAHRLPVFHLVGMPSLRIQRARLITHHSLGESQYGGSAVLSAQVACVSAQLTADTAIAEIERVIREALRLGGPAYILIPEDQALMPIIGDPVVGQPLNRIKRSFSTRCELDAALRAVVDRLGAARNPVAIPTALLARFGLTDVCQEFLTRSGIPFVTMPMDKGVLSETQPGYLGLYNGSGSWPEGVQARLEQADLILDIGGYIDEDLNTGLWTGRIPPERLITLGDTHVTLGSTIYTSVALADMLAALVNATPVFEGLASPLPIQELPQVGQGAEPVSSAAFYPRLQGLLRSGDTLVAETGSCMLYLSKLRLPDGVGYQCQTLWGSTGWATPAAMGVAMAEPGRRVVLVTGDGAHQFTASEIGVMGRYGITPIIFVLNNGLYGIEDLFSEVGHVYDDLARWNYCELPHAMGCRGWFTARVATVIDLERVLTHLETLSSAAYIEVMIPPEESQPMPDAVIDHLYRVETP